jgi:hypothetical protein
MAFMFDLKYKGLTCVYEFVGWEQAKDIES